MKNPLARALAVARDYASLPRGVLVLCVGVFVNNLGNFVAPFLTLILTQRAGLTSAKTGLFVTLSALVALCGLLLGGRLVDKIGRRVVLAVFTGLSVAIYIACAFAVDRTLLLVGLLLVFSLCNAVAQPVQNTIMMDVTSPDQRKKAFSLQYVSLNAGFAVGPLMASLLYAHHLRLLFVLDAATTLAAMVLTLVFIPESHPFHGVHASAAAGASEPDGPVSPSGREAVVSGGTWSVLRKRPQLLFFIATNVLFFLVFSQINFGLSLQAQAVFGEGGAGVFGLMMTVNALCVVILSIPATHLFRRRDPLVTITAGSVFYAVGFGLMGFVRTEPLYLAAALVWTLGEILVSPSTNVYLAGHTPASHRGRFNAIFPIIRRIGFAAGPALAGAYASLRGSITAIWVPTGLLAAAAGGLTLFLLAWQRRAEARDACQPNGTVV